MNKFIYRGFAVVLAVSSSVAMADETDAVKKTIVSAAAVQAVTAPPSIDAVQKRDNTVLISPRTGMRYKVSNAGNRPIIFKTDALQPISAANVSRIAANNPALSQESQQKAEKALLDLAGVAVPQVAADATGSTTTTTAPAQ